MLRKPAVAGIFYPDNPEDLKKSVEDAFLSKMGVGEIPILNDFDSSDYPIKKSCSSSKTASSFATRHTRCYCDWSSDVCSSDLSTF